MEIKKLLLKRKIIVAALIGVVMLAGILVPNILKQANSSADSSSAALFKPTLSQIMAGGAVVSLNQETLHFQTGGKLAFLPFKEGDQVFQGQIIVSLDNLEAQKNVTSAEASYRSAKAGLDLVIDNIHLFQYGNGGFTNVGSSNETQTQKTQRQQAEEVANVAFDNLQKAKKQLENTTIVAPFDGTIIHEDVKDIGVNVTPNAGFVLADLKKLVFRAQAADSDIGDVNVGDSVLISLDSARGRQFNGTISKIYPEKIRLSSGGEGYKVDIESGQLVTEAKFGANGSVLFEKREVVGMLVPAWTVLANQYIWVMDQNTPKLKPVKTGETFGDKTQILEGLSDQDKVILDPEIIIKQDYPMI